MKITKDFFEEYHYTMVKMWCRAHSFFSKRWCKSRSKTDLHRMIFVNKQIWKHVPKCKKTLSSNKTRDLTTGLFFSDFTTPVMEVNKPKKKGEKQ